VLSLRGVPVSSGSDAAAEGALLARVPPRHLVTAGPECRRDHKRRGIPDRRGDVRRPNLYTLNYEALEGPGARTEPSASTWVPFS
jgi:hypothetical protein